MTSCVTSRKPGYEKDVTYFRCQGEVGAEDDLIFDGSICASGELDKILRSNSKAELNTCHAFGIALSTSSAFTTLRDTLRCLCVKNFFILQNSSEIWKSSFSSYSEHRFANEFTQCREDICIFLNFLKRNVKLLLQEIDSSSKAVHNLQQYIKNLKLWSLSFGRISKIPLHILNAAVSVHNTTSAGHCLFHLKLDFWWSLIAIHHALDTPNILSYISCEHKVCPISQVPVQNHFVGELILFVLWDLVTLASFRFEKLHVSDYLKVSPFHCSCVKEFWLLLVHLIDYRHENNKDDALWMYLHYIFQEILSEGSVNGETITDSNGGSYRPDTFECKKPVDFCLWIISSVAVLWKYDSKGKYLENKMGLSNYFGLQKLVTIILNLQDESRTSDENRLQFCLRSCLNLSQLWEPDMDLLIKITDYFLKNLNTCHQNVKLGIEAHCFSKNSGHGWIEQVKDLVSRPTTWVYSDSSFHLFILYTVHQLQQVPKDKLIASWRRVSGRTFLKLTRPRLTELSETGLHNLLTLLLTLGCISGTKDVCNKLIAMESMLTCSSTKRSLVWTALFALVHYFQQTKEDTGLLTKSLEEQFSNTVQSLVKLGNDYSSRQPLQKLIILYLNEVQNVFDCSPDFSLSEHLLIGDSLSHLLSHCSVSELSLSLFTVQQALVQFRIIREKRQKELPSFVQEVDPNTKAKHQDFVDRLLQHVLPFLEGHSMTQTPPDTIANIAAGLALLASEGFRSSRMKDVSYFLNKFGLSGDVNSRISSIFLCHVLPETNIVDKLSPSQQIQIFGVWLRSVVSTVSRSQQVEDLGRLVFKLPEVSRQFPGLECSVQQYHHDSMLIQFFRLNSLYYIQSSSLQQKSNIQNCFQESLMAFTNEVKKQLKNNTSQEMASHVFKLAGNLVFYCSMMLYSVGTPGCLLPVILETTVLPLSLVKEKVLSATTLNACKEYLHLFFFGLVQQNFRGDPYIERKLKDLITDYLPKFPEVAGKAHPFMNVEPCAQVSRERIDDVMLFIVETVCERFLCKSSLKVNSNTALALRFVNDLVRQVSATIKPRVVASLFPAVLELLLVQDSNLNSHLQNYLACLNNLTECKNDLRQPLVQSLHKFVESRLAWQSRHVLPLVEKLATSNRSLVKEFLPLLTRMVEAVEEKRGAGLDKSLRQGLMNVMERLQKK